MTEYLLLFGVTWYGLGVLSFVYWWIKAFELTADDTVLAALMGIYGPIGFLIGWWAHNDVMINKRFSVKRK